MPNETREEKIKRLEEMGYLDPNCPGCKPSYDESCKDPPAFGPSHKAMKRCRSGGYNHCTCDTCF